jgi:hypothetical protein
MFANAQSPFKEKGDNQLRLHVFHAPAIDTYPITYEDFLWLPLPILTAMTQTLQGQ